MININLRRKNSLRFSRRIIVFLILLLIKIDTLSAQHLIRECSTCKFMPKRSLSTDKSTISKQGGCTETYECPACAKKDKEEKEARRAEDKRVFEEKKKKLAEENRKLEEDYKRKIDEANAQRKASRVTIENSKTNQLSSSQKEPSKSTSKYMTFSQYNNFYDSVNNLILHIPEYLIGYSTIENISSFEKPELKLYQFARVEYGNTELKGSVMRGVNEQKYYYSGLDLIDYKGNRIFNNKYLYRINHLIDGWFLLSIDSSDLFYKFNFKDRLYNIFTKKTIPLIRNWDWGKHKPDEYSNTHEVWDADDYFAADHFMVLYDSTKYSKLKNPAFVKRMKSWLLQYHSNVFSEKMLLENELVLFVTADIFGDYRWNDDFQKCRSKQRVEVNGDVWYSGGYHGLIIVSKNGTVKKIDL